MLTVELPATIHRDLVAYAEVLGRATGQSVSTGAFVLAENALDRDYLDYVRDPANGYLSQSVTLDEARGNELTVVTR